MGLVVAIQSRVNEPLYEHPHANSHYSRSCIESIQNSGYRVERNEAEAYSFQSSFSFFFFFSSPVSLHRGQLTLELG